MAMSLSGAVLSGIGSSFHNNGAKLNGVNTIKFGRTTDLVVIIHRKKSLIHAVKSKGNILDDFNEGTKKASDFMTDKTKEAFEEAIKAKDYIVEKTIEGKGTVVEEAQKASDFVTEKTKEGFEEAVKAKDYIVEKTIEGKDNAVEEAKKASEYVSEKAKDSAEFVEGKAGEAKDAIKS